MSNVESFNSDIALIQHAETGNKNILDQFEQNIKRGSKDVSAMQRLWKESMSLQNYLCGEIVDFGAGEQQISARDSLKYFENSLPNNISKSIAEEMWKRNTKMRKYLCGEEVNFGTDKEPSMQQINRDDLLFYFQKCLSSRRKSIINEMWMSSSILRNYLCEEKEVDAGAEENFNRQKVAPDDWVFYFKKALLSRYEFIIKEMWKGSKLMQRYLLEKKLIFRQKIRKV